MPTEEFNNERARISKQRDDIMDIMTNKFKEHIANEEELQFHPDPTELWREFHLVVAPVVVREAYDYEQQYDDK